MSRAGVVTAAALIMSFFVGTSTVYGQNSSGMYNVLLQKSKADFYKKTGYGIPVNTVKKQLKAKTSPALPVEHAGTYFKNQKRNRLSENRNRHYVIAVKSARPVLSDEFQNIQKKLQNSGNFTRKETEKSRFFSVNADTVHKNMLTSGISEVVESDITGQGRVLQVATNGSAQSKQLRAEVNKTVQSETQKMRSFHGRAMPSSAVIRYLPQAVSIAVLFVSVENARPCHQTMALLPVLPAPGQKYSTSSVDGQSVMSNALYTASDRTYCATTTSGSITASVDYLTRFARSFNATYARLKSCVSITLS